MQLVAIGWPFLIHKCAIGFALGHDRQGEAGDKESRSCSPIKGGKLVVQSYTTEVDTHNHAVVIADDLYKHASGLPVPRMHSTIWLCQLRSKQACRDGLHG